MLAAEVLCALVPEDVRQTVDEVIVGNGVGASGNIGRLATLTAHFPQAFPRTQWICSVDRDWKH